MSIQELLQWQNLIFILPGIASVLYLMITAVTGFGDGGHDVDADHDMDTDHDMSHDSDADQDADQTAFMKALSFLGIGRVPLSIIVLTFGILWFLFGFISNLWISKLGLPPFIYFWISLGIALLGSIFFTKIIASLLHKWMPNTETYNTTKADLVGKTGVTNYRVTDKSGYVNVTDNFHATLEVACRTEPGKDPIPCGAKVVLNRYLPEEERFVVCRDPLEELIKKND